MNFQNISPFERLACFYVTITGNFKRFQYFKLETIFLKNENFFSENWSTLFYLKALKLKTHNFHTKLTCQDLKLRQMEWGVQSRPILSPR